MELLHLFGALICVVLGCHAAGMNKCGQIPVNSVAYCNGISEPSPDSGSACASNLNQSACFHQNITADQLAQDLYCFVLDPQNINDQSGFLLLLRDISLDTLGSALDLFSLKISGEEDFTQEAKQVVLIAVWDRLKSEVDYLSTAFLTQWFQQKLLLFLDAIPIDILNCMTFSGISCDSIKVVVQALDSAYCNVDDMGKGVIANWISKAISIVGCSEQSSSEWLLSYWKSFSSVVSYQDLYNSWNEFDGATVIHLLTAEQLAQFAAADGVFSNDYSDSRVSQQIVMSLAENDIAYVDTFMSTFSNAAAQMNLKLSVDVSRRVLGTVLIKLNSNSSELCSSSMASWYQEKLKSVLFSINVTILSYIPPPVTCNDFQALYKSIDGVYSDLDDNTKHTVYEARLKFLKAQKENYGDACTYLASGSKQWFDDNLGQSSVFFSYTDIISLYSSFNGMETVDEFTASQLAYLTFDIDIFRPAPTPAADYVAQQQITAIMNSLNTLATEDSGNVATYLDTFTMLASENNVEVIQNINVEKIIWDNVFELEKHTFINYTTEDWVLQFQTNFKLFFASIDESQLQFLTLENCSYLKIVVKGFSSAYSQMVMEVQDIIAQWILKTLKALSCDVNDRDWLTNYWQDFSENVDITEIIHLNPNFDVFENLDLLTDTQMADLTVISGALTNLTKIDEVLTQIEQTPGNDDLTNFWDELSSKVQVDTEIDSDVSYELLISTVEQLKDDIKQFNDTEFGDWFDTRLTVVLSSINATVLDYIPDTISCESSKAVVSGLDKVYSKVTQSSKDDIVAFVNSVMENKHDGASKPSDNYCSSKTTYSDWIDTYYGSYSEDATFSELNVYRGGEGNPMDIVDMLVPDQIGEMMATTDILTSITSVNKLFEFFKTQSVSELRESMSSFTTFANETHITVDASVGKLILSNYLVITSSEISTYNEITWKKIFETEIYFCIQYFSASTLQYIVAANCNHLIVIVQGFDLRYEEMTQVSRDDIVNWIISSLAKLQGCKMSSVQTWTEQIWGSFIQDISIKELKQINKNFDASEVLQYLDMTQLAEYIVTSGALKDVSKTKAVLNEVLDRPESSLSDIESFLTQFDDYLKTQQITVIRNEEVRNIMETRIFTNLSTYFETFDETSYQLYFEELLTPLLPSIDQPELDLIPLDISCSSFFSIVQGLNKDFALLTTQQQRDVFDFIIKFLNQKVADTGDACTSSITDSTNFLETIFGSFCVFATVQEFESYYSSFDVKEVLSLFTAEQLAETTVEKEAYTDLFFTAQILAVVDTETTTEVETYFSTFSELASEKKVKVIENTNVRDLLWDTAFKHIANDISSYNETQYQSLFQELQLMIPSIRQTDMDVIPLDINCQSFGNIVAPLSKQYDQLSDDQRNFIHTRIKDQLNEILQSQGSACTENVSAQEWTSTYYGQFIEQASIEEITQLNSQINILDIVQDLNSVQLVDVVLTNDALRNHTMFFDIFESINNIDDLGTFFDTLNNKAPDTIQNCEFGGDILDSTIIKISTELQTFTEDQVTQWFDQRLENVLYNVNETILQNIPNTISCGSYEIIYGAVNQVFTEIDEESRDGIYQYAYQYLSSKVSKKSGAACGSSSEDTRTWLTTNIGQFSEYAKYDDFVQLNPNFNAFEVLDLMTSTQLADISVESDALNDEDVLCQILSHLDNVDDSQMYEYLARFNLTTAKKHIFFIRNDVIRKKLLVHFFKVQASKFSTFNPSDWTNFLQHQQLFLPSVDAQVLSYIPSISCDSFQVIVEEVSQVFSLMSSSNQNDFYQYIISFLQYQFSITGSACTGNSADSSEWLNKNFGSFSAYIQFDDLTTINPDVNWLENLETLNGNQLADVALQFVKLDNVENVNSVMKALSKMKSNDAFNFLNTFQSSSAKDGINYISPDMGSEVFNSTFPLISSKFSTFNDNQWADLFLNKLPLFLAGVTGDALQKIPKQISCAAFQSIVAGLDMASSDMSQATEMDVFNFIKDFLNSKKKNGSPCTDNVRGDADWLQKNFGSFSGQAVYKDFTDINSNFDGMNALAILSPTQLAQMCFASDALQNKDKMLKILDNFNADSLSVFINQFNTIATQKNLARLPNADVQKAMLSQVFCILTKVFSSFMAENYAEWFQGNLKFLLSSINKGQLGSFPKNLPCDSFQVLVKALSDVDSLGARQDVFDFIMANLKSQIQSTGSACAIGVGDDSSWLTLNFGAFSDLASYSDLVSLKSDFNGLHVMSGLSWNQLGGLVVQYKGNPGYMTAIFNLIENATDSASTLGIFLDSFQSNLAMNSLTLTSDKVSAVIAMRSFKILSGSFSDMETSDFALWMQRLGQTLSSANSTLFDYIPDDISCDNYQALVSALNNVYSNLTPKKRSQVYGFQKRILQSAFNSTESACAENTVDINDWLSKNLGAFCPLAQISDFSGLNLYFTSVSLPDGCPKVC